MQTVEFKLKQASAILGVSAKDLQNLVQLKVIRPARRHNLYWFNNRLLLEAKVAFYLKESLGSSSELVSVFTQMLSKSIGEGDPRKRRSVSLRSRPALGTQSIEIKVPIGNLARELEEQFPRAATQPDLARGRRRAGWRAEMSLAFEDAARQMGNVSMNQVNKAIRQHRSLRKALPEVTIVDDAARKTA
jgi:hypothetical protein